MKLTERQKDVISRMADGWELAKSLTSDGGFWIQKGGTGKGGETQKVYASTAYSLLEKGLIKQTSKKFPTAKFALTEKAK